MEVALAAGFEEVVNDPWLWRHGLRVGVGVAPKPWVEVAVAGVWYPIGETMGCESPYYKDATCELWYHTSPMVLRGQLQATARILPVVGQIGRWTVWVGGHAGFALVRAWDHGDEPALQVEDPDPRPWYPGPVAGLTAEIEDGRVGVRARFEQVHHVGDDSVTGERLEQTLGLEVLFWIR